ncbi:type II CAAX endopeptidase family protein [Clostridiaceae bacterium 35-E11]
MEDRKKIGILGVNMVYLITAILLLTVGAYVQRNEVKSGLIITEYILVLLPPIIYAKIKQGNFKKIFRLNRLSLKHGLLIICITTLVYPVALFFNLIVMTLLSTLGKLPQPPIPTANNMGEYFLLMMIIAVSAGICEEVFFRGLVLRGYEKLGQKYAVIISAILFGLFHFNLQNFAGPTILGLVFGYLVYRTNSLWAGVIGHITNNGVAVTLGFMINVVNQKLIQNDVPTVEQMPDTIQLGAATFSVGIIALLTGTVAYFLLRIIIRDTQYHQYDMGFVDQEEWITEEKTKSSLLIRVLPILITVMIYFYVGYLQIKYIMK